MISRVARTGGLPVLAAVLLVGLNAPTARAHVDPDPAEAPAGSEQAVEFTVQHGCAGSPTVQLDMRLPEGVSMVRPESPAGWTASVEGDVVTFVGGPLAGNVEETFRVRMILPLTAGETIYFPFVQRCEVGEIRWIDIPQDGSGAELDEPAPAMRLTAPLPGATLPPPMTTTTHPPSTMATPSSTTSTSTTIPTSVSRADNVTTTSVSRELSPPPVTDPQGDERGGSGTAVFIGSILAVGVVATLATLRARRHR